MGGEIERTPKCGVLVIHTLGMTQGGCRLVLRFYYSSMLAVRKSSMYIHVHGGVASQTAGAMCLTDRVHNPGIRCAYFHFEHLRLRGRMDDPNRVEEANAMLIKEDNVSDEFQYPRSVACVPVYRICGMYFLHKKLRS